MELLARVLRDVHITAGAVALFVAPGAMLVRKGGAWHRRWGKIYFWCMAAVAATALSLSRIHPNLFLGLVGIFSFYMALSGYRVLYHKKPLAGEGPVALDWAAAGIALAGGAGLVAYSVWGGMRGAVPVIPLVFGLIGILLAGRDMQRFVRPRKEKNAWWYTHMGNFIGAYIATVTAFSATNLRFLPMVVRWLWPTAIGVPLIIVWIRYYKRLFNRPKAHKVEPEPAAR